MGRVCCKMAFGTATSLQCTQNTVSVQIQVLLDPPDSVPAGLRNPTCKPGLEKGSINLLVGQWAGRTNVDGWEASIQEGRSLGTRWSPGSNPVLHTACWETSDRSLDLPVL